MKTLKPQLRKKFGSLRAAARSLSISPWRLSSIINGWIKPTKEEQQAFKNALNCEVTHGK